MLPWIQLDDYLIFKNQFGIMCLIVFHVLGKLLDNFCYELWESFFFSQLFPFNFPLTPFECFICSAASTRTKLWFEHLHKRSYDNVAMYMQKKEQRLKEQQLKRAKLQRTNNNKKARKETSMKEDQSSSSTRKPDDWQKEWWCTKPTDTVCC